MTETKKRRFLTTEGSRSRKRDGRSACCSSRGGPEWVRRWPFFLTLELAASLPVPFLLLCLLFSLGCQSAEAWQKSASEEHMPEGRRPTEVG